MGWRPDPAAGCTVPPRDWHTDATLAVGADGLAGPSGAFVRGSSTTGVSHARGLRHGAVSVEGWLPVTATGAFDKLSVSAFALHNEDAPALAERGFRFSAAVVQCGPGGEAGAHVYWRLLVPQGAVPALDRARPLVGEALGQHLHV